MEDNLSERYNEGVLAPPEMPAVSARLPQPGWRPTPAQVDAARQQLTRGLLILALLVGAGLLISTLAQGWRP